ncbi:hypothetical protein PMNALOAF_2744 [Methylobacterium adhaesivum]|uniref:Terminase small subunit n=1 Tax=Methylobacterium adhaesivum TaxID=333297 RepID=A0ABT8BIV8_9HYPH|nr:terminase small subunit [Methylobacterium adhaesivum]MDN3592097.1 terminase small subunit [Methylobacterium adhaesivum]GJD31485.1 hypothetical protein PMNALOAF_2744 [Methylobacterium adhaesivum]
MGRILNRAEVAETFGYSLPTVDTWIKDGLPARQQGAKGVPWQFDSAEVHAWLVKKARATRRTRGNAFGDEKGGDEQAEGHITLDEAKRRKEVANAKSAELDFARDMDAVAPIDMIAKVLSDEIANARARLLAIPTKFRPSAQLHASDPERAKKLVTIVDELIHSALTEIKAAGVPK